MVNNINLLDKILEIYGVNHTDSTTINSPARFGQVPFATTPDPRIQSGQHIPFIGPANRPIPPLTSWQIDFSKRIIDKQDTYASIPPAAGKTGPILQAFHSMFLSAIGVNAPLMRANRIDFKSPRFPRLIYIGRTKQLSIESMVQNFRGHEEFGMIITCLMFARQLGLNFRTQSTVNHGPPGIFNNPIQNTNYQVNDAFNLNSYKKDDVKRFMDYLKNQAVSSIEYNKIIQFINDELIAINMGGIKATLESRIFGIKPIIITTPDTSGNSKIINKLRSSPEYFSTIVIDEMQEYIPRPGTNEMTKDLSGFFNLMIDTVSYASKPGQCGVHLLTGTTHQQTGEQIMKEFNTKFGRNFKLPDTIQWSNKFSDQKNPNYAGNRVHLTLKAYDGMKTAEDKIKLIKRIVINQQANSIVAVFATNASSVNGILKLLSQTYRDLIPLSRQIEYPTNNTNGNNRLVNMQSHTPLYTQNHGVGTLSDAIKMNIGDDVLPEISPKLYAKMYDNTEKDKSNRSKFEKMDNIEFLKYFDINLVDVKGGSDQQKEEAKRRYSQEPDENNILYQGVIRGIGILFGQMDNRHKETIISLFRAGKIYCLLATDALGVGANVLCKNLYLTSTEKAPTFNSIDKSSLLQLIHRAGRTTDKMAYASIYVDPSNYEWVYKTLNQDPTLAVEPINPELISKAFQDKEPFINKITRLFTNG